MAANDVWGGFASGGAIPATLVDGVAVILDSSTTGSCKFHRTITVKGGDTIEFSSFARAITGLAHMWIDIGAVGTLGADVDITGHDDWRRYTVKATVPLYYNDVNIYVGVGTYISQTAEAEFRLPNIKVNNAVVFGGTAYTGVSVSTGDDLQLSSAGVVRAQVRKILGVFSYQSTPNGFPIDPVAEAIDGLSIGHGANGRLKIHTAANNSVLLSRGNAGMISTFYYTPAPAGAVAVGSISITASATTYNTSSDYRLKNEVVDLSGSGEFIDALRPRQWSWSIDGSKGAGFIAHELQAISPTSVTGEKDGLDDDGNPEYQSVGYGSAEIIANLVAEVKALRQRVASLEAK